MRSILFAVSIALASACAHANPDTAASPAGPEQAANPAEPAAEANALPNPDAKPVPNPDAKPGDTTDCPLSGKLFVVKADSPTYEYRGKTFVFCCPKCKARVTAEPGKYLDKYFDDAPAQ